MYKAKNEILSFQIKSTYLMQLKQFEILDNYSFVYLVYLYVINAQIKMLA
jgi:hypothetical protein